MRSFFSWLFISALSLAAGCALLSRPYRPPHAPKQEGARVKFPWGSPRETVFLTGAWLRAVTMALDDFLPEEEAELAKGEDPEGVCLARRDSYSVDAFAWSPGESSDASEPDGGEASDAGQPDGGKVGPEAGLPLLPDGGYDYTIVQPGMPRNPPIIYVSIALAVDCNPGGSPLMDVGALYAIDTVNWRILAIHH